MTLADALRALYAEFGCYQNDLSSFTFEGPSGMVRMKYIMSILRSRPPKTLVGQSITGILDYLTGSGVTRDLPRSNVLEFRTETSKVLVRPSGTEPKIKIYLSSKASTLEEAQVSNQNLLDELTAAYME